MKREVHTLATSVSILGILLRSPKLNVDSTEYFGLKGVLAEPSIGSARIPALVFCVYQLMFAAITYVFYLLSSLHPPVPFHLNTSLAPFSRYSLML